MVPCAVVGWACAALAGATRGIPAAMIPCHERPDRGESVSVKKRNRAVLTVLVLLVLVVLLSGCMGSQQGIDFRQPTQQNGIWNTFVALIARALIWLNDLLASLNVGYSWGWAIIVFTILIKLVTLPLTLKQLQSTKATQELQPKLAELQAKYGKDKPKLMEEQQKLYKEAGVNPLGGCLPLLIQMPILFGLYQALYALANAASIYPEGSKSLQGASFYWIPNLTLPSLQPATYMGVDFQGNNWIKGSIQTQQWGLLIAYFSLPVIMLISQLILQKMTQPSASKKAPGGQGDQTQMMGQMMMIMPIFFGYITLGLPAGLTLYWSVSNILSLVQQYFVTGWGGLGDWIALARPKPRPVPVEDIPQAAGMSDDAAKIKRRRRRK